MRQKVGGLVQQVDAQLVIGDADMDVQTTDRQPPPDRLQIVAQARIAAALGGFLRIPAGKRVGRGGDRRHAVMRRHRSHRRAQPPQVRARLAEARADPCPDLDLRAQEFRAHLPREQRLAFSQHLGRRIADDIARRPVDEEIFFFDAEGEFRLRFRHLGLTARRGSSR